VVQQVKEKVCFSGCLQHAGGKLRVVDFLATWCGPCKQIKPSFRFLCKTVSNDLPLEVDVDVADCQDAASECEGKRRPPFQLFKKGPDGGEFSEANEEKT
uniref:Thioredoxin domain-containing protein n=2 Tax=Sus scrofa TaxID=9823 RepID=A0A8D0SJ14_PIG